MQIHCPFITIWIGEWHKWVFIGEVTDILTRKINVRNRHYLWDLRDTVMASLAPCEHGVESRVYTLRQIAWSGFPVLWSVIGLRGFWCLMLTIRVTESCVWNIVWPDSIFSAGWWQNLEGQRKKIFPSLQGDVCQCCFHKTYQYHQKVD